MFGKNPLEKKVDSDGLNLRVVKGSPFRTIQGEGPYAGRPSVFIRLHGCNLACTFCDTQFSDPDDPTIPVGELVRRTTDLFGKEGLKLVVLTGGEPLRQNVWPLLRELYFLPHVTVQIETAGTLWVDRCEIADIVCSPKTPAIHPQVYAKARAFKYVIDVEQERDGYIPITATQAGARPAKLAAPRPGCPVYLSPMDMYEEKRNAANRKLVGELALRYGVNAGLQLHKHMELD